MKYKFSVCLLALALTACGNPKQNDTDAGTVSQAEVSPDQPDISSEGGEQQADAPEMALEGECEEAAQSDLERIIKAEGGSEPPAEVPASEFDFEDMDYLFLVKEEMDRSDNRQTKWYEYALLGGPYDTYEKGAACYMEVNSLFERYQYDRNFDSMKERFGGDYMKQYYQRHITAFSPEADRILLKSYMNPPNRQKALYEVHYYRGETGRQWPQYWHSYIYRDIIFPDQVNYTKGIRFATLNAWYSYGRPDIFYKTNILSNYDYCLLNGRQYNISTETDAKDTVFYKDDINPQGDRCLGIYSISDNSLVFQSEAIPNFPLTIEILDSALIAGFLMESSSDLKYIKIDMETGEANELLTYQRGSFSPDGRYLACPAVTADGRGFYIYSVETGEETFIKSYGIKTETPDEYQFYNSGVYCWVNKDKIEELKGLAQLSKDQLRQ
ncbi:hypothetical protein [Otoolea muris]|uniref:hypothetical protein n=1 Tax=Otoolea muris TaxID=2941515 RepID=UPI00203CD5F6|nr:hypothetical protein [Otoolea muris]